MSAVTIAWPGLGRLRWADHGVPRLTSLAFGGVIGGIGVIGLSIVLMINVAITQGAFEEAGLKSEVRAIEAAKQRAQQTLAILASPGSLESRARAMGMVPAASPVFLRLSDAAVIGDPQPASYQVAPDVIAQLMPQQVLAPDLQTAPAAQKATRIPATSDAAVELEPSP